MEKKLKRGIKIWYNKLFCQLAATSPYTVCVCHAIACTSVMGGFFFIFSPRGQGIFSLFCFMFIHTALLLEVIACG